ncbi:unnamed protein product [Symbiodinium sp. KB8]|nr:unnamed protein product [Symbiodinium sp. KB8]
MAYLEAMAQELPHNSPIHFGALNCHFNQKFCVDLGLIGHPMVGLVYGGESLNVSSALSDFLRKRPAVEWRPERWSFAVELSALFALLPHSFRPPGSRRQQPAIAGEASLCVARPSGDTGITGVGRDRPHMPLGPSGPSVAAVTADAMQGLAETLEIPGVVVTLRQLSALHSWLSLFEDRLPPDSGGMSLKDHVAPELHGLVRYLRDALHSGSAAAASFALCRKEWEIAADPLRKQLLAASDLLRLQAGASLSDCHGPACRAWALLHSLAVWKTSEVSTNHISVESTLKVVANLFSMPSSVLSQTTQAWMPSKSPGSWLGYVDESDDIKDALSLAIWIVLIVGVDVFVEVAELLRTRLAQCRVSQLQRSKHLMFMTCSDSEEFPATGQGMQRSELNFLSLSCDVIHTAFVSEGLVQQLLLQTRCLGFRGHVSNMEMRQGWIFYGPDDNTRVSPGARRSQVNLEARIHQAARRVAAAKLASESERVFHAANLDAVNAAHPHMDDPRFISLTNQSNNCILRFTVFARCARELGEEDTRCKYQYYRAQCACPESQLEDWMEHRARGSCHLDVLPDRSTVHCKQ